MQKFLATQRRGSVREIGALGETLGKLCSYFLLLILGNENAKRSPGALASQSAPEPGVFTPVPVLASSHSAVHGHLLLPSRPQPRRKPPLEFVLIPRSKGCGQEAPTLRSCSSSGQAGTPLSPPAPGSLCLLAALGRQKWTPDSIPLPPLGSCALALSSHLGDANEPRCPRRRNWSTRAGAGGADRLLSGRFQSVP